MYTPWTCASEDLNNQIGNEVTIELIVTDCAAGQHFGYAYLDGLCNSEDMIAPTALVQFDEIHCQNQAVIFNATGSFGFDQYRWKVCKVDAQGQTFDCIEQSQFTIGSIVPPLDIRQEYVQANVDFNCDQRYRIDLTLNNQCSEEMESNYDFFVACEEAPQINYLDIINCRLSPIDLPIQGDNDCPDCTVAWTAPIWTWWLDDPSSPFPIVQGSINPNALLQDYYVAVTNTVGCTARDTVNIYNVGHAIFQIDIQEEVCDYRVDVSIGLDAPVLPQYFSLQMVHLATGEMIAPVLLTPSSSVVAPASQYTAIFLLDRSLITSGEWELLIEFLNASTANCNLRSDTINFQQSMLNYGPFD
ncbi:MAG: hypothetical protein AAGD05_17565, partial [Bacteroidota bacterium]